MTLDDYVYSLADLLDEKVDVDAAVRAMENILSEEFTVDQVVTQFTIDYACGPDVYVENLNDDANFLLDDGFDSE